MCHVGGREKAPAAFCRKAITSTDKFEMWGDGIQTRSFTFIDECVEGVLRLVLVAFLCQMLITLVKVIVVDVLLIFSQGLVEFDLVQR